MYDPLGINQPVNTEDIKGKIKEAFPNDYETAIAVSNAESTLNPNNINTKNTNGSIDYGLFQINSVHIPELKKAGIIKSEKDLFDVGANIAAAKYIHGKAGGTFERDWKASKGKWGSVAPVNNYDPLGINSNALVNPNTNNAVIKTADKQPSSILDEVSGFFKDIISDTPSEATAKAQNALMVANDLNVSPSSVDKKMMINYAGKQGAYTQPESKDMLTKLMLAPVAAGLMSSPLLTLFGVGTFAGLAELENYAVSKFKNEPYKMGAGKGLPELAPEETSSTVKDVLWLTDMAWQTVGAGALTAGAKEASGKIVQKYMRDITEKYELPKSIFISPDKIREFHGLGREEIITPEESDLLKSINMSRQDYVSAVRNGIDIEIPTEKIVTIKDKPWFQRLKSFFKMSPYEETIVTPAGEPTGKQPVAGLIGNEEARSFSDILSDINTMSGDLLSEAGKISVVKADNLKGDALAARDRLAKDYEIFKQKAESAGMDIFKYMTEKGLSKEAATYMVNLGKQIDEQRGKEYNDNPLNQQYTEAVKKANERAKSELKQEGINTGEIAENRPDIETALTEAVRVEGLTDEEKAIKEVKSFFDEITESNDIPPLKTLSERIKTLEVELAQMMVNSTLGDNRIKNIKNLVRIETGQVKTGELMVSEYDALNAAMKKAEQASRKAMSEGRKEGALEEKQRLYEIAQRLKARIEAKQEAKSIRDGIIKIIKDDKLPIDYKDKIANFLSDYDMLPRSEKTRQRVESTREFLDRMEGEGEEVNIPKSLLDKIERYGRTHWKDLSLDELKLIYDEVSMLAHLGKLKNKLLTTQAGRTYENTVSNVTTAIKNNWPQSITEPTPEEIQNMLLEKSALSKANEKRIAYLNELIKPEYIFRRLDKWEDLGPVWTAMYKPLQDAYNQEALGLTDITDKLQKIFEPFTKKHGGKWANKKYTIEGVPQILTKEKMIMVALNTGNEGNLNALREGMGWDDTQIRKITEKLDASEWKLVNEVWNLYDEIFPKLADVYLRLTGARLQKVEGRYHPLVFDRTLSWIADKNAAEQEQKDFFQTIYTKPKVTTGSVIERKGGKLPPKLSFDVIFKHLGDVNHYVTHVESVRDVQKLLSDSRIRSAIETAPPNIGGKDAYNQLMPWLQDIAKPKTDPLSLTESFINTVRSNTTSVALALKFSVAAFQWLGTTQSIEAVGHNEFVKGFVDFYTHRQDMVETIKSKSPEMANRAESWDRELRDAYGKLGLENFKHSQIIKDAYFSLITLMDMAVAYPTWQASFTQGMEKYKGDEAKAIDYADMKVRNSQGNALPKDLASIQRGGALKKLVTMFYTFFSAMHNQISEANNMFKYGEKNIFQLLKSWWWVVVAPAVLSFMMTERKVPTPKDVLKQSLQYRLGGYPVIRDITSPVFTDYDYQFSPAARFGTVAGKAIKETVELPTEDRDFNKWLKSSFETTGYLTGIPAGQALITMKGINDLANGNTTDITRLLMRAPKEE